MAQGVVLAQSSAVGAFTGSSKQWNGGRASLVINAAQYGASVQLQVQNSNGIWVPINVTTISADACTGFDVPAGQVRMFSSGSSAGMTANLVEITYK